MQKEKADVCNSPNIENFKKETRGLIFDIQGHACPYDAITISEEGKVIHDRNKCDKCKTFECIQACYYEATSRSGKYYTVDDLMRVFKRDRQFWGAKGGVTFSGGEPLMQKKFVSKVIKECKKSFIHVTVETTSCIAHDYYMDIMNYIDWVFTDIKHMDPAEHKRLTGVDNSLILKNIEALAKKEDWEGFVVPRIPVINNFNDSEENIRETAKFVKRIGLELINLLPFHRLGESKYRQIGRVYSFAEEVPPKKEKMIRLKKVVEEEGLYCFVGYETPF